MADTVLGGVGKRVELRMALGAGFGPERLTVALADGTADDLTGATFRAALWRPGEPVHALEVFAVAPAVLAEGTIDLSLSQEALSVLAALDGCKKDPLRLEWGLFVTQAGGLPQRTHYGPVLVYLGAQP